MPEVPTLMELGTKGFDLSSWFGLVAPAGTPPEVIARLHKACNEALQQKSVRDAFAALSLEVPDPMSPVAVQTLVNDSYRRWGELVKANNIAPE
ncbi:Tripartite tricarboxylate transporter family receptor [compost metagenome]